MANSFGENIRNFRDTNRLTQSEFAMLVAKKLSKNNECDFAKSITNWESGNAHPKMEVIFAIAELMGISLDDLFKREVEDFKSECAGQTLPSNKFEKLSDQDIYLFYYILQDLRLHSFVDNNERFDVFQSLIFVKSEKKEKAVGFLLKNEDITFEKEAADLDDIEILIAKWLNKKVLVTLIKQEYIYSIDWMSNVHRTTKRT